jgi:KUP system potassium uptake protein
VVILVGVSFFTVDALFLGPNILKIPQGGWFPLLVGGFVMLLMITWRKGRRFLAEALARESLPLKPFIESLVKDQPVIVPGTAVFMASSVERVPNALLHNLKHNKVLHERVVFLTVQTEEIPFVPQGDRVLIEQLAPNIFIIRGFYGFQESPNVLRLLQECESLGLTFDLMDTSFFLSREHLIPSSDPGLPIIVDKIFAVMTRNAMSATDFFNLPPNRVVELGTQIEI